MITRQYTSFEVVNVRFTWIKWIFTVREILGEFRIRGLQIGLYLRNISNENLGIMLKRALLVLWCLINLGDHAQTRFTRAVVLD